MNYIVTLISHLIALLHKEASVVYAGHRLIVALFFVFKQVHPSVATLFLKFILFLDGGVLIRLF